MYEYCVILASGWNKWGVPMSASVSHRKISLAAAFAALVVVPVALLASPAFADTATADATAEVKIPIAITAGDSLQFGEFAAETGGTGGTVVIGHDGARSFTGDVMLIPTDAGQAASFDVTGDSTYSYAITLPENGTVTLISGENTMAVNDFVSSAGATSTLSDGSDSFTVGATLTVGAGQVPASYTGTFDVTVEYN